VHKEAGQRSKIQGARGLDLKDLLLLPCSPPSLPRLLVLITLGLEKKTSKGCSSTHSLIPPLLLFISLFVLPPSIIPRSLIPPLYFSSLSLCAHLFPPFYFSSLSLCFHPGIIPWLCYGNKSLFLRGEWIGWLDPGTGK
jgi:hypothetical protein